MLRGLALTLVLLAGCNATLPARWFKGNLHTHTLWSDGNDFPEMVADWYASHGYNFLALSDHNIFADHEKWIAADLPAKRNAKTAVERCRARFGPDWLVTRERNGRSEIRLRRLDEFRTLFEKPGRFLMIAGEEITDNAHGRLYVHINASNIAELIPPQHGRSVQDVIRRNLKAVAEQSQRTGRPILAHLNHPNFGWAITAEDIAAVVEERFFEVYNGHTAVHHTGDAHRASTERIWDIANTLRIQAGAPPLYGLATDDSHHYFGRVVARPGRGWVMVRAAELAPDRIIDAMRRGDFYASSGVRIDDVRLEAGVLHVDIAPDRGAGFQTVFIGTLEGAEATGEPVRDAKGKIMRTTKRYGPAVGRVLATVDGLHPHYRLTGRELYVRAVVTSSRPHPDPSFDGQHQQAWTQPVGWR